MTQAYDFALDKIGMKIMSYQVCFVTKVFIPNLMDINR